MKKVIFMETYEEVCERILQRVKRMEYLAFALALISGVMAGIAIAMTIQGN